ncbi:MAG: TrkA family potassium uptake protein [Chitinophagales bacterium]
MKDSRFAIIGLGRFGTAIAKTLSKKGAEVVAIDVNEEFVDVLRDDVAYPVTMDATDIKALKAQSIEDVDVAIVAIGTNFESELLITANLLELKVKRIIARAMNPTQKMILEKIGVKEIVSPEVEVGVSLAEKLLNPGILTFLQLPDDYEIVEVEAPVNCVGRTLRELDLRKKYQINLITIKRKELKISNKEKEVSHVIGVPDPETEILETDTLLLLGINKDINRFIEVNQ